jgi:uncharacterized protein
MGAPVMWFEIVGKDAKKLQDFYGSLFEWKIDANNPMNYGMVDNAGQGINGGVGPSQSGQPWFGFYVAVQDLQATLDKAGSMGGKTLMPPTKIPDGPEIALFADPEGNQIGIMTGM